jgi:hypothetical protein
VTNELAKELLFTNNLSQTLENVKFDIVKPQKVEFSGSAFPPSYNFVSFANFENAIKINISQTGNS